MNVLILTPDRVGSTLLQRLITVYANINENQTPLTVNLHELTNGLVEYPNKYYKTNMLGKKPDAWGYHQSLSTITQMLSSRGHDVVSRLAHYHIKKRRDSLSDQLSFYQWLNENFYIIAARRENLFEHAMSWCISAESKKLNVYSFEEKHQTFAELQKQGINIQPDVMDRYLTAYQDYLAWVDAHFTVNAYFEYERDLPNIENFIVNLGCFRKFNNPLKWHDRFDISWADWNRMHYLLSLVSFDYQFSAEENDFMTMHIDLYGAARIHLQDLQDQGILVSGIPIKLHTLGEKASLIQNIDQCLLHYNHWVNHNQPQQGLTYTPQNMEHAAQLEYQAWRGNSVPLLSAAISQPKLMMSDLKFD